MTFGLTRRQQQALEFIREYAAEHERMSPSIVEIGARMGTCKSNVFRILTRLEERGAIRRLRNRARAIEVVETRRLPTAEDLGGVFVGVDDHPRLLAYCRRTGKTEEVVISACINRYMGVLELEEKVAALTKTDR